MRFIWGKIKDGIVWAVLGGATVFIYLLFKEKDERYQRTTKVKGKKGWKKTGFRPNDSKPISDKRRQDEINKLNS